MCSRRSKGNGSVELQAVKLVLQELSLQFLTSCKLGIPYGFLKGKCTCEKPEVNKRTKTEIRTPMEMQLRQILGPTVHNLAASSQYPVGYSV